MNLAKQLPFVFENRLAVRFSALCKGCKGVLPAEWIEAELTQWGAHIVVIKGIGNCLNCGHVTSIYTKIRDDKSVYDQRRGEWVTPKADFRGDCRRILARMGKIKAEILYTILGFILAWAMLITSSHFMRQKLGAKNTRMVSFLGQNNYVTGKEKVSFCKSELLVGGSEISNPVKEIRQVKIAGSGNRTV